MNVRTGLLAISVLLHLVACSGGSPAVSSAGVAAATDCSGACANAASFLTAADVELVIAQAVAEANARGVNATIAVVDRVGNVLGVFRMGAKADRAVLIASAVDASGNATL